MLRYAQISIVGTVFITIQSRSLRICLKCSGDSMRIQFNHVALYSCIRYFFKEYAHCMVYVCSCSTKQLIPSINFALNSRKTSFCMYTLSASLIGCMNGFVCLLHIRICSFSYHELDRVALRLKVCAYKSAHEQHYSVAQRKYNLTKRQHSCRRSEKQMRCFVLQCTQRYAKIFTKIFISNFEETSHHLLAYS